RRTEISKTAEPPTEISSAAESEDDSATPAEPVIDTDAAVVEPTPQTPESAIEKEQTDATNDETVPSGTESSPIETKSPETQIPTVEDPKESTENVTSETESSPI